MNILDNTEVQKALKAIAYEEELRHEVDELNEYLRIIITTYIDVPDNELRIGMEKLHSVMRLRDKLMLLQIAMQRASVEEELNDIEKKGGANV